MKWLRDRDVYYILKDVAGKKVILYGRGIFASEMILLLRTLDVDVAYCVDDASGDNICCGLQVRDIYALLAEREPIYVLIAKKDCARAVKKLKELALVPFRDYGAVYMAGARFKNTVSEAAFDVVLGHSCPHREVGAEGVKNFGNWETAAVKIAILGGSTSDPCLYGWKSWGEIFYDRCLLRGDTAVVIGAVAGYSSSQELIKMIRDILPRNPNIIISYSGDNESASFTPYVTGYQHELFASLDCDRGGGGIYNGGMQGIVTGKLPFTMPADENWLRNQCIMHAVATGLGIRHVAFLQSNLVCKKRGAKDEEMFLYCACENIEARWAYYDTLRNKIKGVDYIIDATEWLDDADGVLFDHAHALEEGNRIIANRIYDVIFGGND